MLCTSLKSKPCYPFSARSKPLRCRSYCKLPTANGIEKLRSQAVFEVSKNKRFCIAKRNQLYTRLAAKVTSFHEFRMGEVSVRGAVGKQQKKGKGDELPQDDESERSILWKLPRKDTLMANDMWSANIFEIRTTVQKGQIESVPSASSGHPSNIDSGTRLQFKLCIFVRDACLHEYFVVNYRELKPSVTDKAQIGDAKEDAKWSTGRLQRVQSQHSTDEGQPHDSFPLGGEATPPPTKTHPTPPTIPTSATATTTVPTSSPSRTEEWWELIVESERENSSDAALGTDDTTPVSGMTGGTERVVLQLELGGSPCSLLQLAMCDEHLPWEANDPRLDPLGPRSEAVMEDVVTQALPSWPESIRHNLAKCPLIGPGSIVFDPVAFLSLLFHVDASHPIVFPHAAWKLQLPLDGAMRALDRAVEGKQSVVDVFESIARTEEGRKKLEALEGGRLVGVMDDTNEMLQVSEQGVWEAVQDVRGACVEVTFPSFPLGLGFCARDPRGQGTDAVVYEVDPGSLASEAGVRPGWQLVQVAGEHVIGRAFQDIDALFDIHPMPITIVFQRKVDASNLYAVELPAKELFEMMIEKGEGEDQRDSTERKSRLKREDFGAKDTLSAAVGGAPVAWQEEFERLFIGDRGSMTVLHTDLIPQLEVSTLLTGTKVIGLVDESAADRVLTQHISQRPDHQETRVPSCSGVPLTPESLELLQDSQVSLALLRPGDLALFLSALPHFATNSAHEMTSALFFGWVTPAIVPHLCTAASTSNPFTLEEQEGEYHSHLTPKTLIEDVQMGMKTSKFMRIAFDEYFEALHTPGNRNTYGKLENVAREVVEGDNSLKLNNGVPRKSTTSQSRESGKRNECNVKNFGQNANKPAESAMLWTEIFDELVLVHLRARFHKTLKNMESSISQFKRNKL